MPIYDYHCDHCGHAFSAVQRFADDAIAACPSCGKPPRRLLSNPALVFKGSGWYKTDSRGPDKRSTSDKNAAGDTGDAAAATAKAPADGPGKATERHAETAARKDRTGAPATSDRGRAAPDAAGGGERAGGSERAGPDAPATTPAKKPEKAAPASS